ncbi:MAG: lactate racemase domain-containing protein [Desulfobulbus sp.]
MDLRYGEQTLAVTVPAHADILSVNEPVLQVNQDRFIQDFSTFLPAQMPAGPIAIVVADKTRLCDYPRILSWLTELLLTQGARSEQIRFYIAYGTHARQTDAESLTAYGPLYAKFPFIHHQSTDLGQFVDLGRTRSGTPVRIRRELVEAALIITVGAISHHYFAGFGGGRKLLFPGLGEQEAIYRNHRLFLDTHTRDLSRGCRSGQFEQNPVATDLEEINALLPHYLSIHGLLDSHGQVVAFHCGNSYQHFLTACAEHDQNYRCKIRRRYPLVLASAGGFPKDINFIQSHKAIDNSSDFVEDGGHLILLAQCRDGIGSTTFLPYFEIGDRNSAFETLLKHYSGNGGTALSMMAKSQRISISLVTDLEQSLCTRIGVRHISLAEVELMLRRKENMALIPNSSMLIR